MKRKGVFSLVLVLLLVVMVALGPLTRKTDAAAMVNAFMVIDDITAERASGATYIFGFQTSQSFSTPSLVIEFGDSEDEDWCTTAGTLTVTGVTNSVADVTGHDIDTALPGTLSATCTQGGVGTGDKITVTGISGSIISSNTYGISLSGNAGALGTSADGQHLVTVTLTEGVNTDTITFGVQILNDPDVVITATVSEAPTVTCSLSTNSVSLGTLYKGGAYVVGSHTINAVTSSSAEGYYWAIYGTGDGSTDAGLYKSVSTTYLIPSTGSATINLNSAEGFGLTASQASGATVSTDFQTGTPGVFGALDRAFAGAQLLTYQHAVETGGDTSTITYGGRAGAVAEAGSYQETVTFICGGYY